MTSITYYFISSFTGALRVIKNNETGLYINYVV